MLNESHGRLLAMSTSLWNISVSYRHTELLITNYFSGIFLV